MMNPGGLQVLTSERGRRHRNRTSTTLSSFLGQSRLYRKPGGRRLSCLNDGLFHKECPRSDDVPSPHKRVDISNRRCQLRSTERQFVLMRRGVLVVVTDAMGIVSTRTLRGPSASKVFLFLLFIPLRLVFRGRNCLPLPSRGLGSSPRMLPLIHLIAVGGKILWIKGEPKFAHVRKELLLVEVRNAVDVQVAHLDSNSLKLRSEYISLILEIQAKLS